MFKTKVRANARGRFYGIAILVSLLSSIFTPIGANAAFTACTNAVNPVSPLVVGSPVTLTPGTTGTGGSPVFTLTTGTLPAGLSLAPTTGVISGTPSEASVSPFTLGLSLADGGAPFACSGTLSFSVLGKLTPASISNLNLDAGVAMTPTAAIAVTGLISGSTTFAVTPPTLPAGLSLAPSTGVISGTPTTDSNGQIAYTMKATDGSGRESQTISFSISVNSTISPTTQTFAANLNQAFASSAITVRGFTPSFTISPLLPTGLNLDPSSGAVYGTPTALLGSTTYTITATGGSGPLTSSFILSVVNNRLATPAGFTTTTGNQSATVTWGAVANASTYTVTLNGGAGTCTTVAGSVTATCSGLTNGTSYTVSVVANATGSYSASNAGTTSSFTPNAQLATPTNLAVVAGNASATITWTAVAGATSYTVTTSPASTCTFNANLGAPSAVCSGLTNGTLTAVYVVATANGFSNSNAASQTFTPAAGTLTPAYQTLEYVRGNSITPTSTFTATGFSGTISYVLSGTLPTGLVFSTSTGVISGTPLITLTPTAYTVTATGSLSGSAQATIVIRSKPGITPTSQTLSPSQGVAMLPSATLVAVDFASTPTYTVSPTLPAGLTLNAATGVISGTALVTSPVTTYTITGVDSASNIATTTVILSVVAPGALSPVAQALNLTQGVAMTASPTYTATGFTGTITYTVAPALPAGLSINPINGSITGTPTAIQSAATYVVTATGSTLGRATSNVVITVSAPVGAIAPLSQTLSLTRGAAMTASQTFAATGFTGAITYSVTPALPAGLTLNSLNGSISGTPSLEQASTSYVITARGATAGVANATVVIAVAAGMNPPSTVNAVYTAGKVIVTWSASTGAINYRVSTLPAGPVCVVAGLTATCTELKPGTNYQFMVQSINSANVVSINAAFSNEVSIPIVPAVPATKKFTFYYGYKSTQLGIASYNSVYTYLMNLKNLGKQSIKVQLVAFVPSKNATALDRRTALTRATNVRSKLVAAGLTDLQYVTSNSGRSTTTGAKSRRIDITITYQQ